jgi:hypothetical protein
VVDHAIEILVVKIVNFTLVGTRISDVPLPVQIPLVFARHDLAPEKVNPLKNVDGNRSILTVRKIFVAL